MYEIVGGVTVVTSPGNIIKEPPGTLKKPEIHVPVALKNVINVAFFVFRYFRISHGHEKYCF